MSSMNEEQNKELIRRTLRGEKQAFELLVRKYQQPIMNYIGRMVGDRETAADFTQDVFVRAYASLRSFEPNYKFTTWLFRIASNLVIDHWRKKKIPALSIGEPAEEGSGLALDVAENEPSVARKFELAELSRRIENLLERLPASQRELFVWRHVNELSYKEMAEIKNLPLGTVKNRVYQAKETIRRLLEESS